MLCVQFASSLFYYFYVCSRGAGGRLEATLIYHQQSRNLSRFIYMFATFFTADALLRGASNEREILDNGLIFAFLCEKHIILRLRLTD
jgi:hypothetical protein